LKSLKFDFLEQYKNKVDEYLKSIFQEKVFFPPLFNEAIKYTVFTGGKKIRASIILSTLKIFSDYKIGLPFAASVELIHTYSLIHDDLPSMDNDDYRRGKLSNHKMFGEELAILAGDGLGTFAYEIMVDKGLKITTKDNVLKIIKEIAHAAGPEGMVSGQAADILVAKNKIKVEDKEKMLNFIHTHKTQKLIAICPRIGGILGGCSSNELQKLSIYGEKIGLAFQIIDDVLDVEEEENTLTYPKVYGIENSKHIAKKLIEEGKKELIIFGKRAGELLNIADLILNRSC
jgi:geranylgeranyl diphosphate synthase type II